MLGYIARCFGISGGEIPPNPGFSEIPPKRGVPPGGAKKCTFFWVFNNSPSRDKMGHLSRTVVFQGPRKFTDFLGGRISRNFGIFGNFAIFGPPGGPPIFGVFGGGSKKPHFRGFSGGCWVFIGVLCRHVGCSSALNESYIALSRVMRCVLSVHRCSMALNHHVALVVALGLGQSLSQPIVIVALPCRVHWQWVYGCRRVNVALAR